MVSSTEHVTLRPRPLSGLKLYALPTVSTPFSLIQPLCVVMKSNSWDDCPPRTRVLGALPPRRLLPRVMLALVVTLFIWPLFLLHPTIKWKSRFLKCTQKLYLKYVNSFHHSQAHASRAKASFAGAPIKRALEPQDKYGTIEMQQSISIEGISVPQSRLSASEKSNFPRAPILASSISTEITSTKLKEYKFAISRTVDLYPESWLPREVWYIALQFLGTHATFKLGLVNHFWSAFIKRHAESLNVTRALFSCNVRVSPDQVYPHNPASRALLVKIGGFSNLRKLSLRDCDNMSSYHFIELFAGTGKLVELELTRCNPPAELDSSMEILPRLERLSLNDMSRNFDGLFRALSVKPQLRYLEMRGCIQLGSLNFHAILGKDMVQLDTLVAINCGYVLSALRLDHIAASTSGSTLRRLEFQASRAIRDEDLIHVASMKNLALLRLFPATLAQQNVDELRKSLVNLRTLAFS